MASDLDGVQGTKRGRAAPGVSGVVERVKEANASQGVRELDGTCFCVAGAGSPFVLCLVHNYK